MKIRLSILFLLVSLTLASQEKNIFLDRTFWKSGPTVGQIKQKIKEGNDPTEKATSAFDAVSYGLIDNAPSEGLKYLLTLEGNPVTKPTHGGITYLLWATYKGNKEMMKHLLELGSDPKMSTARGTNMLLLAAIGGVEDIEVYEMIFDQGIDPNYTSNSGINALLTLSGSNVKDLKVFEYLMGKGISIDSEDKDGNNLFNYAARGGNLEVMKMWISKGVPYKTWNHKGENPVLFASQGVRRRALSLEVFNYLSKELGLEVDQVNWEGKTPLQLAARRATPELLDFFVAEGVSANQVDENGNIALINAVSSSIKNLESILKNTQNINHQNHKGEAAITRAVKYRAKKAFDFLKDQKADLSIKDTEGNNLLYHVFNSFREGKEEIAGHMITELQKRGIKTKTTDKDGNTLAHIAIEKHSVFLLNKAITMGVNINYQNKLNLSPLHFAAMQGKDKELMTTLIANGANKELKTEFNESAYDLATENELLKKENVNIQFLRMD